MSVKLKTEPEKEEFEYYPIQQKYLTEIWLEEHSYRPYQYEIVIHPLTILFWILFFILVILFK